MDDWLSGLPVAAGYETTEDIWDPGFEGDRRIVISQIGSYFKIYKRPRYFVKRFYHKVYPLTIEDWKIQASSQLHGGFCTIEANLSIRFQATLKYVEMNLESLPKVNDHIKIHYEGLIRDALDKELLTIVGGNWVQDGLGSVEKQVQDFINETLMIQNIQSRSVCVLKPHFEEFPEEQKGLDGRFTQEAIYINVLKKHFEFKDHQQREQFRHDEALELSGLEHQEKKIEQLRKEEELVRLKQAGEAQAIKQKLEEHEKQLAEQHTIEKRLHDEKLKHESRLKEMEAEAEMKTIENKQTKQQNVEQNLHIDKLKHQITLKEKELETEISEYERQQEKWNQTKSKMHSQKIEQEKRLKELELKANLDGQEKLLMEQQQVEERLKAAKLRHSTRMKEMELEAEFVEQEKRYETSKKAETFLRRDIEHLVLEKRKAELNQEIRLAEQNLLIDKEEN
ncbi:MAG: hypothetical protein V3U75_01100 [Methylococcaceae bacterium]